MMDDSELISTSDITSNGLVCGMIDNFINKLKENRAIVVNTDINAGAGVHWVTMILHDGTVYIIDPLGEKNISQRPYDDIMFKAIEDANYDVLMYPGKFQDPRSSLCGFFSIYTAKILNKLKDVNPETIYDTVDKAFGLSADRNDVDKLMEGFGLKSQNTLDTILD